MSKNQKQVFYYDDFLGQTFLKNGLGKNEDSEICTFIRQINKMQNKKLILATREHILNQAIEQFEKFLSMRKFESIISISDFSSIIKAQILFNHLWHSKIGERNIQEILKNKNYLKIIRHPNFNPRIIEWMTKKENVNKEDYFKIFFDSLQHPDQLWKHAFENELLESSKIFLIVLISYESYFGIEKDNFFKAYTSAYRSFEHDNFNDFQCLSDFEKSLKELDGTFVKTELFGNDRILIKFSNPSIKDYLQSVLTTNKLFISHICESSINFEQLLNCWTIVEKTKNPKDFSKYFDYEIYLRSINRFINEADCEEFDKILLHLIKISQTIRLKSYVDLTKSNFEEFKERIRYGSVDSEIIFKVYSELQRNPTIFSIDFTQFEKMIKKHLLSKEHYHLKELTELIDNFNDLNIELDDSEIKILKKMYNSVIDQGIITDSIEESDFGIYEYNPATDSFDHAGYGVYGLETLTQNIERISSYLDHDSDEVLYDLEAKIVICNSNLPKNKESPDLIDLDVSNRTEEMDIDSMFESLLEK